MSPDPAWAAVVPLLAGAGALARRALRRGQAPSRDSVLGACAETVLKLLAVLTVAPAIDAARRRWPAQADALAALRHDFLRRLRLVADPTSGQPLDDPFPRPAPEEQHAGPRADALP